MRNFRPIDRNTAFLFPPSVAEWLPQIETLFVEVLKLAGAMGMLEVGTVALDGTRIDASASRPLPMGCRFLRNWNDARRVWSPLPRPGGRSKRGFRSGSGMPCANKP